MTLGDNDLSIGRGSINKVMCQCNLCINEHSQTHGHNCVSCAPFACCVRERERDTSYQATVLVVGVRQVEILLKLSVPVLPGCRQSITR